MRSSQLDTASCTGFGPPEQREATLRFIWKASGGLTTIMKNISMESVLETAGIRSEQHLVQVLRDGFPSYAIRVRPASPERPTVIVKACPDGSWEPDVLLRLHRAGFPVPAVLDMRQGDGFRAVVMEDVGEDVLHKHPDEGSYLRAAEEIAWIHRRCDTSGLEGLDYHDGNVLIGAAQGQEAGQLVIVDWDSARLDSGFFDLVSLCDVADRMGTLRVDHARIMEAYLRERCAGGTYPRADAVETEWRRCCVLRAWNELRWFSETGEDFGDRVAREARIIGENLDSV